MKTAEAQAPLINEVSEGKVLEIQLTGKLDKRDYDSFVPVVESAIQKHGKIRMLVEMRDFHGWTAGGLWQDLRFDARHFNHIERLALVGETKWQRWMSDVCKPFTTAKVRFFDLEKIAEARQWLTAETVE